MLFDKVLKAQCRSLLLAFFNMREILTFGYSCGFTELCNGGSLRWLLCEWIRIYDGNKKPLKYVIVAVQLDCHPYNVLVDFLIYEGLSSFSSPFYPAEYLTSLKLFLMALKIIIIKMQKQ